MSIENLSSESENSCEEKPCSLIKVLIEPKEKDIGDFSVRRLLPSAKQFMVGPWILFDHMGPADFESGKGINVRPHPHINLATVTYLFKGEIWHQDSLGSNLTITPGAVNLMLAGKGITHSEREKPETKNVAHSLDGLQLWLALPEEFEESEPAFYHYAANLIPETIVNGVAMRVLMGEVFGLTSPVKTFAKTLYLEAKLSTGQTFNVPDAQEVAVYVVAGKIKIADKVIDRFTMAVLNTSNVEIICEQDCQLAIIGGEKLSQRYIYWNFVSSRKERIEQAITDWQNKKFPIIASDNEEFIPIPKG